ncbi:unnamed protein product [Cuscuta epithymum]|uniref:Uncharacterized protein n=1 Tax=Cuscuta epithymum TaxID=186058 RepID=A0AAV0CG28_9ASTE|nr:unnamed protein product [Cuscuta epithymum]
MFHDLHEAFENKKQHRVRIRYLELTNNQDYIKRNTKKTTKDHRIAAVGRKQRQTKFLILRVNAQEPLSKNEIWVFKVAVTIYGVCAEDDYGEKGRYVMSGRGGTIMNNELLEMVRLGVGKRVLEPRSGPGNGGSGPKRAGSIFCFHKTVRVGSGNFF